MHEALVFVRYGPLFSVYELGRLLRMGGGQQGGEKENKPLIVSTLLRVCAMSLQSCPTLCDPMNYSLPGSSVHGILQARILEYVAIPFSRDLPDPGIEPGSPALQASEPLTGIE